MSQYDIENSLGIKVKPLTNDWMAARGILYQEHLDEQAEIQEKLKQRYVFEARDWRTGGDNEENRKLSDSTTHIIIEEDEFGFLKARHLNINDEYDRALLEGNNDKALEIALKRLEENPDDTHALFDKAYALSELGRNDEALKAYQDLTEQWPDNTAAWNNMAIELYSLGREEEGLEAYKTAQELDPTDILYTINLATAYKWAGDTDKFYDLMETVFDLPTNSIDNKIQRHNLALNGFNSKEDVQALRDQEKLARAEPHYGPNGPMMH